MDDMTAFERRIGDELRHEIGPLPRFDAMGIVRTTTTSPRWRFQSMFSATKFVVAGAIVALFGGFLLAGVLTQPSEESVPAAGIDSPAPTTTEELLSRMTMEEVEPGVFRVVNDGVRELAADSEDVRGGSVNIVSGLDGSVWWLGPDAFFRLGDKATHAWPEPIGGLAWMDLAVAPDGTLWGTNTSFDGRSWTGLDIAPPAPGTHLVEGGLEVQSDGTVWISHSDVFVDAGSAYVSRLTEGGWERVPGTAPWDDGSLLAVAEEAGDVWMAGQPGLYRLDESGWHRHPTPAHLERADVGPDGTLWIGYGPDDSDDERLARLDGSEWQEYAEGPDPLGGSPYQAGGERFEVAPDGSVWFNPPGDYELTGTPCDGVANFDGESLAQLLRDACIFAMDVAPDGHVWLVAGSFGGTGGDRMHTYVITPEAVAATE
jgi:hypothetical protein